MFGPKIKDSIAKEKQQVNTQPVQKQLDTQEQVIRELFEMVKLMANHKRYEYIQKKIDVIQNLLDKVTK